MNKTFMSELNALLVDVLNDLNGRAVTLELYDDVAKHLNARVHALYASYGFKAGGTITRDVVIHLINLLVENGSLKFGEIDSPKQPEPETEADEPNETIEVLTQLWQQFANNRQFIEAQAVLEALEALQPAVPVEASPTSDTKEVPFPEGWGDNLVGNFDAQDWAKDFAILADIRPSWAKDEYYLTAWFANAIMTGYDKAHQEEYPVGERGNEDYVYVEFYDVTVSQFTFTDIEEVEATFKFNTVSAAKEFIKLNAFGDNFKSKLYRMYELTAETRTITNYLKTELN